MFYLIMDIAIHWCVLRYLRKDTGANVWVPTVAILLNVLALGGFVWVKLNTDLFVIGVAVVAMIIIGIGEQIFLTRRTSASSSDQNTTRSFVTMRTPLAVGVYQFGCKFGCR